jgi:hypothetical protein
MRLHLVVLCALSLVALACNNTIVLPDSAGGAGTSTGGSGDATTEETTSGGKYMEGVNLDGSDYDYAYIETVDACHDACKEQEKCAAFTWIKAGAAEDRAICYYKYEVPSKIDDDCCVSGVITR